MLFFIYEISEISKYKFGTTGLRQNLIKYILSMLSNLGHAVCAWYLDTDDGVLGILTQNRERGRDIHRSYLIENTVQRLFSSLQLISLNIFFS